MEKEKSYFCVRIPESNNPNIKNDYNPGLYLTQSLTPKKAINNAIYNCIDSKYEKSKKIGLVSNGIHEEKNLSQLVINLDEMMEASKIITNEQKKGHLQLSIFEEKTLKEYLYIKILTPEELAKKIGDELGYRIIDGENDCLIIAKEYLNQKCPDTVIIRNRNKNQSKRKFY